MKDFFKGRVFKVILCVLALALGAMIYAAASGGYASVPEAIVGTVVTPVLKASSSISDSVGGFFNMLLNAKDTEKENKELKRELSEAYKDLSDLETYKNENAQLKDFLEIKENNPDYKMQSAQVIGSDSTARFGSFTVDKGSTSGIKVNAPVITYEGLVGIVSRVGPTYSVVQTILDPDINVGVYNSRTGETGVVGGEAKLSNDNRTKLRLLPRDTALLSGDIIETSGIGGVFPQGLLIGTIENIRAENSGVSMYAVIKPIVDVDDVTNVMILTDFSQDEIKEQADEETQEENAQEKKPQ